MDARTRQTPRLTAFGNELVTIHLWLREELARLGADVDAYLDGRGERPRDLRAHCLSFCSALSKHHTGEDSGAFPCWRRHRLSCDLSWPSWRRTTSWCARSCAIWSG